MKRVKAGIKKTNKIKSSNEVLKVGTKRIYCKEKLKKALLKKVFKAL